MTPSALHDLVTGEYRMPDGTTRRGLLERVPETALPDMEFQVRGGEVDDRRIRTALFRVAIEDWIEAAQPVAGMRRCNMPPDYFRVHVFFHSGGFSDSSESYGGKSAMDALVHAAHAVADTLGVAP